MSIGVYQYITQLDRKGAASLPKVGDDVFSHLGKGTSMCIDSKTWLLAVSLESDILSRIHNADEARRLIDEYTHSATCKIATMAEQYYERRDEYHISEAIASVGTHINTKLSVIRGAIKLVLDEYIRTREQGMVSVFLEPSFA